MLGWLDAPTYHDITVVLQPGEALVLYTDGLTDAHPDALSLDGRTLESLLARMVHQSAASVADALLGTVTGGASTPRDDVAILVAGFHSKHA